MGGHESTMPETFNERSSERARELLFGDFLPSELLNSDNEQPVPYMLDVILGDRDIRLGNRICSPNKQVIGLINIVSLARDLDIVEANDGYVTSGGLYAAGFAHTSRTPQSRRTALTKTLSYTDRQFRFSVGGPALLERQQSHTVGVRTLRMARFVDGRNRFGASVEELAWLKGWVAQAIGSRAVGHAQSAIQGKPPARIRSLSLLDVDVPPLQENEVERVDEIAETELPEGADWKFWAACRGGNANDFFPDKSDKQTERRAKATCAGCQVLDQCLDKALATHETYGIWGGLTPAERKRL